MKTLQRILPPVLLFLAAFALFSPSIGYILLNFDDPVFVVNNPIVFNGFSWASLGQAFTALHGDKLMYTPLLWISYLLDTLFFRATPISPWGFHFTNVLLHAVNAVLFWFILRTAVRRPWLAFFAAAFWAFHPLRVESVAWVTERKDTLSTLFAFASILCYLKAFPPIGGEGAQPPPSTRHSSLVTCHCRKGFQCLALATFAAGLLSKPMLVTLPFLFLLLDYWPLRRFSLRGAPRALPRLVLAKWPFFLLILPVAILTYRLQHGAISPVPLHLRLLRIPVNYLFYLSRTVWPVRLCALTSGFPATWPWLLAAALLFLGLAALAIRLFRRCPGFLVGLIAFAGLLFPVAGIVFIGSVPVADRYSYLPSLGLSLSLLSLLDAAGRRLRPSRLCILHCALGIVLATLAVVTLHILPSWENTEALARRAESLDYDHTLSLTQRFADAFYARGDLTAAATAADAMWEKEPYAMVPTLSKILVLSQTSPADAIEFFENHPIMDTRKDDSQNTLAVTMTVLYADAGDFTKATVQLDRALNNPCQWPKLFESVNAVAFWLYASQGLADKAAAFARRVSSMDASDLSAPSNYLIPLTAMWNTGLRRQTLPRFLQLARDASGNPGLLNNIVWILATAPNSPAPSAEVLAFARQAIALAPDHPVLRDTLAVALAFDGRFDEAVAVETAVADTLRASSAPTAPTLLAEVESRLVLFRARTPYTENADVKLLLAP